MGEIAIEKGANGDHKGDVAVCVGEGAASVGETAACVGAVAACVGEVAKSRQATAACSALAPDWIGEVLSPRTARHDRIVKMPLYARKEVGHAWIVDPVERSLEVYRLTPERFWLLVGAHSAR